MKKSTFAIQKYTATRGGCPRAVRSNCTHMGLYRTKNRDELNQIAKEFAGEVSPEKFIEVYDYIISDEEDRHVFIANPLIGLSLGPSPTGLEIAFT